MSCLSLHVGIKLRCTLRMARDTRVVRISHQTISFICVCERVIAQYCWYYIQFWPSSYRTTTATFRWRKRKEKRKEKNTLFHWILLAVNRMKRMKKKKYIKFYTEQPQQVTRFFSSEFFWLIIIRQERIATNKFFFVGSKMHQNDWSYTHIHIHRHHTYSFHRQRYVN